MRAVQLFKIHFISISSQLSVICVFYFTKDSCDEESWLKLFFVHRSSARLRWLLWTLSLIRIALCISPMSHTHTSVATISIEEPNANTLSEETVCGCNKVSCVVDPPDCPRQSEEEPSSRWTYWFYFNSFLSNYRLNIPPLSPFLASCRHVVIIKRSWNSKITPTQH